MILDHKVAHYSAFCLRSYKILSIQERGSHSFHRYTIVFCRNGLMSMLMLVTGAMCVAKLCRLHITSHPTPHLYLIFYCATLECALRYKNYQKRFFYFEKLLNSKLNKVFLSSMRFFYCIQSTMLFLKKISEMVQS